MMEAQLAVDSVADVADLVYYQAPGAKQVVTVSLPSGVDWANSWIGHPTASGGLEVNLAMTTSTGGNTDVVGTTSGEVRGTWPTTSGTYNFVVRKTAEGYVLISPYDLTFTLSPQSYTAIVQRTNVTSFTLTATEVGGSGRTLTLTPSGDIASWITTGSGTLALATGGTNSTTVTITVPSDAALGYYTSELEAADNENTDSVYITILVVSTQTEPWTFNSTCRLDLNITAPTNTTYYSTPVALNFNMPEAVMWCGYSLDDQDPLRVSGNSTLLISRGEHKLELFCMGESGCSGFDSDYFTLQISDADNALKCFDLDPIRAYNGTYGNVLSQVLVSDNVRGDQYLISFGNLTFINIDWSLVMPGNKSDIVIHNISQTVEHWEDSNQMDIILQWQLTNGWGATVCTLPINQANQGAEANNTCTLYGRQALENPGQKETLSTRLFYVPHAASGHDSHVDWTQVTLCYGEKIKSLTILSPLNQNYLTNSIYFNTSSNALLYAALYSLDGAANQTMTLSMTNASSLVNVANGAHTVTFFGNDSYGNPLTNTTSFSVNTVADTTKPDITIVSPLNQTYSVNYVWANATLNETGSWCAYSLDSGANSTMTALNATYWYYNVTALSNAQHSIRFYCNDTASNMNQTALRYFNVSTAVADTTKPDITIVSPLNQTYAANQKWVYANVTTNESASLCQYSLDSAANATLTSLNATYWYQNVTVATNGSHSIRFYCNDTSGNMNQTALRYFSINVTAKVKKCASMGVANALDSQGNNETTNIKVSENTRADITSIDKTHDQWLMVNMTGAIPAGSVIDNATATVEHYEDDGGITPALQWWNSTAWVNQCTFANIWTDTNDTCALSALIDTVGEANAIDLRMYYTASKAAAKIAYVDYMTVLVCYQE
jgi:hypothetical protein